MAMALGDDPKTVALHYSAWVPERQERLTQMFKKTYREKPKLVGMSGGRKQTRVARGTLNEREASY